jgi:hypothetical protein
MWISSVTTTSVNCLYFLTTTVCRFGLASPHIQFAIKDATSETTNDTTTPNTQLCGKMFSHGFHLSPL